MNQSIEISPIESTAWWWTCRIRYITREILRNETFYNSKEREFASIFENYTEKDWRNFYLELTKCIMEDVNTYIPTGSYGFDAFHQDTDKGGHNRLNSEIAKITGKRGVPDIRLADRSYKDEVIYTNLFGAEIWYKSSGTHPAPTKFDKGELMTYYMLTGNEQILNFYNEFLATSFYLDKISNHSFSSPKAFKDVFCREYKKKHGIEGLAKNFEELKMLFNSAMTVANERGIILGRAWGDYFSCYFRKHDLNGLHEYSKNAQYFATAILKENDKQNKEKNEMIAPKTDDGKEKQ